MTAFIEYNNILLEGFANNSKSADIISKKHDLLADVLRYYNLSTDSILFVGFSPWCLGMGVGPINITEVSDEVLNYLDRTGCSYNYAPLVEHSAKSYSIVVAADEYFTFASSDIDQRKMVEDLAKIAKDLIITTLRDYKNQDFRDREFSQPILVRGNGQGKIFLEHYEYDPKDKNASYSKTYAISDDITQLYGPYSRRNMYFKQLAKFSLDAGASSFYVHKNLMYKSVIKKNYEHVITIKF